MSARGELGIFAQEVQGGDAGRGLRESAIDELEKVQPFLMAMPILVCPIERAVSHVQSGKQGGCPMPHGVLRHRADSPLFERQPELLFRDSKRRR